MSFDIGGPSADGTLGLIGHVGPYKIGIYVKPIPQVGPTACEGSIGHFDGRDIYVEDDTFAFFVDIGDWQNQDNVAGGQGAWWVNHMDAINAKLAALYHNNPHPGLVQNTDPVTVESSNELLPEYFIITTTADGKACLAWKPTPV